MKISEFIPILEKHRNDHFGDNSKTIRVIQALRTYLGQDTHKIYVKDLKFADLEMRNFSHKSWLHFLELKEELCKKQDTKYYIHTNDLILASKRTPLKRR